MAKLILVRHGKSEWNEKGLWTGWTDIGLIEKGREEGRAAGAAIADIPIDVVYVTTLKRTDETWKEIQKVIKRPDLVPVVADELKERSYGIHTGKNKWDIQKEIGDEEFHKLRRGWDCPVEGGETLKDVYDRVVPYYEAHILPQLQEGKNVLVVAHGNSLRALVKYLEGLTVQNVCELEFGIGETYVYDIDEKGAMSHKEVLSQNPDRGKI